MPLWAKILNGALNTKESITLEPEKELENAVSKPSPEPERLTYPVVEPLSPESVPAQTASEPKPTSAQSSVDAKQSKRSLALTLLSKARNIMQFRKRVKLDKIISLFAKRTSISNDEVEKLLHVSDATATRYLSQLEKEGRIRQSGKTGQAVKYTKL